MKLHPESQLTPEDYREILSLPNHLITIFNSRGVIHRVNDEANPVLGWDPQEVIGKSLSEFVHPTDLDLALATVGGLFLGTQPVVVDLRLRCRHKNGEYRWISWTARVRGLHCFALGTDITEKVDFEEALAIQSMVLESISEGVMICDLEGSIVFANSAAEALYGYDVGEFLGRRIYDFVALGKSESFQRTEAVYQEVMKRGIWIGECDARRKDGFRLTVASRVTKLEVKNQPYFVTVQRDITEKIKIDRERLASQEKFQRVSDRLGLAVKMGNIGIWEWAPGSDKVLWDEITEEIYGYARGEFPGTAEAYTSRIHPEDRTRQWDVVSQCLKDGKPYVLDHRIIRKDGSVAWVQGSGMVFLDGEGKPSHMMGTVIDITERKQAALDQKFLAEASEILAGSFEYKENLQQLCQFAEYFCDSAIVDQLHSDGSVERIAAFHRDPGLQEKLKLISTKYPLRYENEHPLFHALVTGKTVCLNDLSLHLKDHPPEYLVDFAELKLNSSITARLKGRESLLGTISFFTNQKSPKRFSRREVWLAEELAFRVAMALENSLLFANAQEAIRSRDEFLSIASHELKTPLTSLTLQNQMKRRQIEKGETEAMDKPRLLRMLENDNRQLMRINRLIDDMLDIARIRAQRLTIQKNEFDFCSCVVDVLDRFRPQMEAFGCRVIPPSCDSSITVIGDVYRIEQVIVNMLTNAMKYGAGKPIKIDVKSHPQKVSLFIHDQGPGIAQEDTERIFQRFERAVSSSEVSGLGLGLYISRQIMEQHDGSLSVTSELGKGSTFIMELPLP